MIEGISEVGDSTSEKINIPEMRGSGDCSREKILNVVLLVMVFVLIGLFAYLFFSDRLVVGVENPFSNKDVVKQQNELQSCLYNGVKYVEGTGFPAEDGCNSCSCTDGEVVCTMIACDTVCVDTRDQCKGKEDGTACEIGVWCDDNGLRCGGGVCDLLKAGECLGEICDTPVDIAN